MTAVSQSPGSRSANAPHDLGRPVPCDHANQNPPSTLDDFRAPDVPGVLPSISPMLLAVILDSDFDFLPAHVEVSVRIAEVVANRNLSLWPWQSRPHKHQPQPRLLWRLRARVDKIQRGASTLDATSPAITSD